MKLHTPHATADWQRQRRKNPYRWQRLAIATNGLLTPGNLISITGLVLVLVGAYRLLLGHYFIGLALVALGRAADLLDGYVADKTHTKSQLGEFVDTACDKVSIFAVVIAAYATNIIPPLLLAAVLAYNAYLAIFAVLWGKRYGLHTTLYGKLAMFTSWLAIILAIAHFLYHSPIIFVGECAVITIFGILVVASIYAYYIALQKAILERVRAARWTRSVTDIVFLYNPNASNYHRAERWLQQVATNFNLLPKRIDITTEKKHLHTYLKRIQDNQTILVAIGGGDGTVSYAVNTLIEHIAPSKLGRLYVLPLWGGNANDFSYMLNGMSSFTRPKLLLAQSSAITVPLIKLRLRHKAEDRTVYACCYASFGASAYAARALDKKRISTNTLLRWLPPLLLLTEFAAVIRAFLSAPLNNVEIGRETTQFYEHTLINGSRIAKVNRVPIELIEPAFFHALVERKDPSILISFIRIIFGKPDTYYSRKTELDFTTKNKLDAQIDGEVLQLAARTQVQASVSHSKLRFISSRPARNSSNTNAMRLIYNRITHFTS